MRSRVGWPQAATGINRDAGGAKAIHSSHAGSSQRSHVRDISVSGPTLGSHRCTWRVTGGCAHGAYLAMALATRDRDPFLGPAMSTRIEPTRMIGLRSLDLAIEQLIDGPALDQKTAGPE